MVFYDTKWTLSCLTTVRFKHRLLLQCQEKIVTKSPERAPIFHRKICQKPELQTDAFRKRYFDPQISQIDLQMVPKWVHRLSWEAWSGLGWPVQAVLARSSLVMSCLPWS